MTATTDQERAGYKDGAWYWVEKEGWHDEPAKIAPAMYRADCDAWYSWEFSGISTPYLKVLEPCTRAEQAARRAPVVPDNLRELANAQKAQPAEFVELMWQNIDSLYAAAPQPPEAAQLDDTDVADIPQAVDLQEAAPVQLPSPIGVVRVFEPNENSGVVCTEASVNAGHLTHGWHLLYTEHQVRKLLAAQEQSK